VNLVDAGGKVGRARFRPALESLRRTSCRRGGLRAYLTAFNGDPSWTLAMPARYVVAPGGTIEYADNNVD
jgi:hypothetical protein